LIQDQLEDMLQDRYDIDPLQMGACPYCGWIIFFDSHTCPMCGEILTEYGYEEEEEDETDQEPED
jgi:uncharacterized OB-fold protein